MALLRELDPISRAFWDDDGFDDEIEAPAPKLEWLWNDGISAPANIDLFLIIDGKLGHEYSQHCLVKNLTPYCFLRDHTVELYHLPNSSTEICVARNYNEMIAGRITFELQPWLSVAKNVVAITLTTFVFYLNTDGAEEDPCCIRALHSECTPRELKLGYANLETPNFVHGLAAGVVTYRQFLSLPSSLYSCFLDSSTLDSMNTEPITKMIRDLKVNCDPFKTCYRNPSNMFI